MILALQRSSLEGVRHSDGIVRSGWFYKMQVGGWKTARSYEEIACSCLSECDVLPGMTVLASLVQVRLRGVDLSATPTK